MTSASKIAVVLSLVGIVLMIPSGLRFTGTTVGDLLLVGAALGYTSFIVLGKKFGTSSLSSSFALIVSLAVISAPIAAIWGGASLNPLLIPAEWESVFWLGVPCTVLAIPMYTRGLASIRAAQSATLLLMEIIVGVTLSVALLGDFLSLTQVLGALTIGVAILLSSR